MPNGGIFGFLGPNGAGKTTTIRMLFANSWSAAAEARDMSHITGPQANAFEQGLPSARVVRLPHASHYVFQSNEADVLREINAFVRGLSKR